MDTITEVLAVAAAALVSRERAAAVRCCVRWSPAAAAELASAREALAGFLAGMPSDDDGRRALRASLVEAARS